MENKPHYGRKKINLKIIFHFDYGDPQTVIFFEDNTAILRCIAEVYDMHYKKDVELLATIRGEDEYDLGHRLYLFMEKTYKIIRIDYYDIRGPKYH